MTIINYIGVPIRLHIVFQRVVHINNFIFNTIKTLLI